MPAAAISAAAIRTSQRAIGIEMARFFVVSAAASHFR